MLNKGKSLLYKFNFNKSSVGFNNIVKFLIKNGTDVNAKDEHGETAFFMATERGMFIRFRFVI